MDRWDLFVWVIAPVGLLVALGVTGFAYRKRFWPAATLGAAASLAAGWVVVSSPGASSESFEDVAAAAVFGVFVVPLTIAAAVLTFVRSRGRRE